MIDFFKRKVKEVKEVIVLDKPINNNYPEEVLKIHNEFNIASDKLLEEANLILKDASSKDAEKVSRLMKLGFTSSSQVKEVTPLLEKAKLSEEQIKLVSYYKQHYPFNKFITEEQVKEICLKYGLICGEISRFKGFVPEKNLKQIESFKLKNNEVIGKIVVFHEASGKIEILNESKWLTEKDDKEFVLNKYLQEHEYIYINTPSRTQYLGSSGYVKLVNRELYKENNFRKQYNIQLNLQICAPLKDMDTTDLIIEQGYKLTKKHIPDPVVLQPVKGGYLIITMWADETFDPFTEPVLRNDEINN